jgi:hypothetical protein
MFRSRWFPRLVALLTLVVALVATVGSASAATATMQVGSGRLVARGAAVDVPVTVSVTCDDGFSSGVVQLFVSQGAGRFLASGEGGAEVACTSGPQTVTARVFADSYSSPFRGGSAVANATLLQCRVEEGWGQVCYPTDLHTSQVIRITG